LQFNLLSVVVAASGFGFLFVITEFLHRRGVSAESTRSAAHAAGAAGAALVQAVLTLPELVVLAAAFTAFLIGTRVTGSLPSVHDVGRRTMGAQLLPAGLLLAVVAGWQHPAASAFGILVLAFADPLAAVVGKRRGPVWRVPGGYKSLPGSAAFSITTLILGATFTIVDGGTRPLAVLGTAVALAFVEAIAGFGLDNLLVPVVGTLAARAWLAL
jgi:dolichol kinase